MFKSFELDPLPFDIDKFNKLSKKSFDVHHGIHHATYVKNLDELVNSSSSSIILENKTDLELIIKESYSKRSQIAYKKIFNNAAQHWNHSFFWNSITYENMDIPSELSSLLEKSFGSVKAFKEKFYAKGASLFGSGWVWLIFNANIEKLEIVTTENALTPILTEGLVPLLVCDVWEHAYYIDFLNKRVDFLDIIVNSFNWEFAQKNFDQI